MEDYTDRVRYGEEDADEALQNAVGFTLRTFIERVRSDVYCDIKDMWEKGPIEARFIQAERIFRAVLNG